MAKAEKTSFSPLAAVIYPDNAREALSDPVLAKIRPESGVSPNRRESVPSMPPMGRLSRQAAPQLCIVAQFNRRAVVRGLSRL